MSSTSTAQPSRRTLWITRTAGRLGLANAPLGLLALAPLFVWLVINWFHTIRAIIRDYNPLPVWDYWRVVQYLDRYKALDFSVLWVQHNEHRIVFPEMIFAADMLLFHGSQWLSLAANFICYFSVWIVLSAAFRSDKTISPLVRSAGILLSGIVIGWQGCVVIVGSAFLLQWTMLQLSVTLGLLLLAKAEDHKGRLCLAGAIACGVAATYSSGNGMLLWPVLILGALLLPLPRLRLLILIGAAAASVSLYFVGYHSSSDLNLLAMIRHPVYLAGFVASYVSMPFGAIGNARVALIIGALNLLAFLLILLVVVRRRLFSSELAVVLLGSYLFTIASAVLTAAGRMNPADQYFIAAKAARYVSLPLVNWAVLLLAMIWLSSRRKWEVFSSGNLIFIASMIFLALFPKLDPWLQGTDTAVADQQWATLSLESGLFSPNLVREVFPDPGFVKTHLPMLQQNHLSIYWNQPEVAWVGHSAKSEFPGTWKKAPTGEVAQVFPITGGAEVAGTGPHIEKGAELVLVDGRGEIVGLGEKIPAGIPTILASAHGAVRQGWVGFLNTSYGSKVFSAYIVNGRGLTQITNAVPVPQLKEATSADVGSPIPGLTWQASHWTSGALPLGIEVVPNSHGSFWSSWNGSDASTGQIVSSDFAVPANHCIILPVLHGPSVDGLSAQIINTQNNKVLAELPLQDGDTQWKLWQFPIDSGIKSIKILGRDKGTGWGQWLALGEPQQCH